MLPRHARSVLSRLGCNGHSLLFGSYLYGIGRIENPSCSVCGHSSQDTSHLILHCPATDSSLLTLWRLSVSLRPLVQTLGGCQASGVSWSSTMPPSLERGRVTNNNNNRYDCIRNLQSSLFHGTACSDLCYNASTSSTAPACLALFPVI